MSWNASCQETQTKGRICTLYIWIELLSALFPMFKFEQNELFAFCNPLLPLFPMFMAVWQEIDIDLSFSLVMSKCFTRLSHTKNKMCPRCVRTVWTVSEWICRTQFVFTFTKRSHFLFSTSSDVLLSITNSVHVSLSEISWCLCWRLSSESTNWSFRRRNWTSTPNPVWNVIYLLLLLLSVISISRYRCLCLDVPANHFGFGHRTPKEEQSTAQCPALLSMFFFSPDILFVWSCRCVLFLFIESSFAFVWFRPLSVSVGDEPFLLFSIRVLEKEQEVDESQEGFLPTRHPPPIQTKGRKEKEKTDRHSSLE